ncbi:MAG TPA: anaerobic ribonucleoside-triphosphate reductase [bacterium]|nr:anaerobic ribonucleoside-triphosphate reductase [bacterium]
MKKNDICGERTEVYSRVVGYYRPVQNWNKGKKEEFEARKTFKVTTDGRETVAAPVATEQCAVAEA